MSIIEEAKAFTRQRDLRVAYALVILGALGVILIGNTQASDIRNTNTPTLTQAQVECFNQMRDLKVDVSGAHGLICRGR